MRLAVDLASDAESSARARRRLQELSDELAPEQLRDLELLVSELVTNAVRHAGLAPGAPIGLVVELGEASVRVEVTEQGRGFDPSTTGVPRRDAARPSGWGLYLVQTLADAWGVDGHGRTCVWFTMRRVPR